jgi:hypothetical protein
MPTALQFLERHGYFCTMKLASTEARQPCDYKESTTYARNDDRAISKKLEFVTWAALLPGEAHKCKTLICENMTPSRAAGQLAHRRARIGGANVYRVLETG